jgi:SAM-dependent methyltransferase
VPPKRYDRSYFERWYHDPRTRIHLRAGVARKARLALHAAEYLLEGPVRSVLDVGCGEAPWRATLRRMRPGVRYAGVDSSLYAVQRYGRARGIRLGRFEELGRLGLRGPFDLVICSDVLHYVPARELRRGLEALAGLLGGLAWIEVFTSADSITGDFHEMKRRSPACYDRLFRAAGLVHCGLCCFVREDFASELTAFERGRRHRSR